MLADATRLLYSSEAGLERKLEAAEQLVAALLGDGADASAAAEAAALPALVRAHYLRSLVEWSCTALTRGAATGSGKKGKKQQQAAADAQQGPARLEPRCWAVLGAVLGSASIAAAQPLPEALLPAATAALQAVHDGQPAEQGAQRQLLTQLAALLRLLSSKFAASYRPGIEHAVAAAEAALAGHAAASSSDAAAEWQPAAVAAAQLLLAAVGGHPNQRKVWDAAVPRLLPLLAGTAFPAGAGTAAGAADTPADELAACCRQLLEALVFSQQHVPALAAAAAAEMAAALAAAIGSAAVQADEAQAADATEAMAVDGSQEAAEPGKGQAQQQSGAGYGVQLFAVLQQQAAGAGLPPALLPWLAGRFCAALKLHRRAAETEAELTSQAGRRSAAPQREEEGEEEGGATVGAVQHSAAGAGSRGGLSASADFAFWVALLRTLLSRVAQLEQAGPAAGDQLAQALGCVAELAGVLRTHHLYRPTQDPAGHQRALLQQLADAALQLAQARQQAACGKGAGVGVLPAALGVLQGILAVEHRVIQQQLPALWPLLLWSPAAASGSGGSGGVAAAVACSLVAAFAELRQLEVLLASLAEALQQPPVGSEASAAAEAVLHSRSVQAALATAVRQLPSGQVPMLLRLAAGAAPQLGNGSGGSLLAADLYCACLASLQVDLTTAMSAAAAAAALVSALSPLLLPLLSATAGGGKADKKQAALLAALLRLYSRALALHARCAALHPEATPLPGQHAKQPDGAAGGHFAPLAQLQGSAAPTLAEVMQAAASGSSPALRLALLQAAEQRLGVLHLQQRYLSRTCPVTLLPEPGAEPSSEPQQQQQQLEEQQQRRQRVEDELRLLATTLVDAAAEEAASSSSGGSAEVLQLVAGCLAVLQEWAEPAPLQQLLQACLRQAVCSSSDARQQLCRALLLDGELLEQPRLAALLPAAAADVLGATLRQAIPMLGGGAAAEGGASSAKKKKKGKTSEQQGAAADGGSSSHADTLLHQLQLLAKGKAAKLKPSAWAAAVEGGCAAVAAAAPAAAASGSSKAKRKHGQQEAGAGSGALQTVQQLAQLLARLPLAHLAAEAASGMAAVAVASVLCCCEGGLAASVSDMLPAASACLQLLACLGGSGCAVGSQQQLLPLVLQAALVAIIGASSSGGPEQLQQLEQAAERAATAMQAACSAQLAAADASGLQQTVQKLSNQLLEQHGPQQCAAAVLAQACLSACLAAASSSSSRTAEILCGSSDKQVPEAGAALVGSTAAELEGAVAGALASAAAAASDGSSREAALLTGSLYRSATLLLRLRCCEHAVADALEQRTGAGSSGSALTTIPAGLQGAAALLAQPGVGQKLAASVLEYVAACCRVTGRMRPAASAGHYSSLLALLLHQLACQPAGAAGPPPPARHTVPFSAAFPAAAAAGSGSTRPLLLQALRELVAGSSSQHLLLPLRYAEAALPAAGTGDGMALPLCELLLVLLESASGGSQQRLLGQHSERLAALLTGFISSAAYPAATQDPQQTVPNLQRLAASILAVGEGGSGATAAAAAPATPPQQAAAAAEVATPAAAEVLALCTALRALESLAARPKLFALPPAALSSMLSGVEAVWTAYAEQQGAAAAGPGMGGGPAALPGFGFRLGASEGAGLFAGCCHLLLALLRHRQQELRRCLPHVLRALRALLRFLAAAELSARLQQLLPGEAAAGAVAGAGRQREARWRVKCAELLAAVWAELAGLKEAGVGRYCPHLLADYILLAAAPPTGRSKALLHYSSPAAGGGSATAGGSAAAEAAAAAAAAAAEEDVLAGEPLSADAAAALRQGAYALYGACSAAEIQFLYASLGGGGGPHGGSGGGGGGSATAAWRTALAALKSDYEAHYKYTGKV